MDNKISVKPDKIRLIHLLNEIAEGKIKIPRFQRDFVWDTRQMLRLFDSIAKGYPIGSLLFWKPDTRYVVYPKIGPYTMQATTDNISYVLDGFQRITALFGVLTNPKTYTIDESSSEYKDYLLYYDLISKEFTFKKNKKSYLIPLYKIIDTFEYLDFITEIQQQVIDRTESKRIIECAKAISKVFYDYEITFVEIKNGDMKSAIDIFLRINSTGTEISEDFMLSALSYNEDTNFLLSKKITDFLSDLEKYNLDTLKRDTILNCIVNSTGNMYFDIKLESLKDEIENLSTLAFIHIEKAIKFLYQRLYVMDVKLLPYPTQLVFISEYFRLNPEPTDVELDKLEKWFWTTTYANYFTITLSEQRSAYDIFLKFSQHNHKNGINKGMDESLNAAPFPKKLNFMAVRPKALHLFLLKNIYESNLQDNETIRESFIFNKKDKTPANVILRLSSEFEKNDGKKNVGNFITHSTPDVLKKYFISEEMVIDFKSNRVDDFLNKREQLIKSSERRFVESLGIEYTE